MVVIKNLTKKYNNIEVINIKELIISDRDRIGIMGLNGSGKSTLGEIIIGTKKQSTGTIVIKNSNLRKNAVFQDSSYDSELAICDIAKFYQNLFKAKNDLKVTFENFELEKVKKLKYQKLSGGQKQKFKFLIALLNNPNLLLLDELTTSLDYLWRKKIISLIKKEIYDNKTAVILISHDINEISQICNRVILLKSGVIDKMVELTNDIEQNIRILRSLTS